MTEFRSDREAMTGEVERRWCGVVERTRKDKATGQIILEGYASTFEPYDVNGGPEAGGWVEQLSKRAFDQTLAEQPDVQLLINHTGTPLARTKSGTLKLSADNHGLRVWASLDPDDPDVKALVPKMNRGDMDEMSFAFRVNDQDWDHSYTRRTINTLSLEKGDVSVVNYGMNPTTKAVLADAVGMLAQLSSQKELAEVRQMVANLKPEQVARAQAVLSSIAAGPVMQGLGGVKPAEGFRAADTGDVKFADPGYKPDGKKRYPINNKEKAKAAWSYINMPKNQKGYTATQVKSIKGRIKGALEKYGVEVSEEKKSVTVTHIEQVQRADGNTTLVAVMSDGSKVTLPSTRDVPIRSAGNGETEWTPSDSLVDAHDEPYEVGRVGVPGLGPVPENIETGDFTGKQPAFKTPSPEIDPHDNPTEQELLAMDNHDDPYDFNPPTSSHLPVATTGGTPQDAPYNLGGQVGSVPGDMPNYGDFPQGPVADNIVTSGAPLGNGGLPALGAAPSVGTAPVDASGSKLYDWTTGTISQPEEPTENLDAGLGMRAAGPSGSWDAYNPETGEGRVDNEANCDDMAAERDDDGEALKFDMGLAEALDRTIVHAYNLAPENAEVRKLMVIARRQLGSLRGVKPAQTSDITRKLDELRKEVGAPDTATVAGGLAFLRSAGTAPVGYRGLLDHDPELHMTTPAERLAKEAVESDRRARTAALESDKAADRLKLAQREAELNAVIRRHRKAL